jgi:tRNA G18 (ribose-2'-O)-methylase SpoU
VGKIWLTGYSPYPQREIDDRLPHLAAKIDAQIAKTALGAQQQIEWAHAPDVRSVIDDLKQQGFTVAALEQAKNSVKLSDYQPPQKLAIIVGREVEGIEPEVLALCDLVLEIPMFGHKESFNVVQAAAMALYHCRFQPLVVL